MSRMLSRNRRRAVRRRIHLLHWLRLCLIALLLPAGLGLGVVMFLGGSGLLGPELASDAALEAAGLSRSAVEERSWCLTLVNAQHALPADFAVELTQLPGGVYVDGRICAPLEELFHAARSEGIYPSVQAGYRTGQQQKRVREALVEVYRARGISVTEAIAAASRLEEEAGHSEHQLGIAVDIGGDGVNSNDAEVRLWLRDNSWRYGFVLRYPGDKTAHTGMDYAPEHYRYVGVKAAGEMYEQNLSLEEYLLTSLEK